MLDDYGVKFIVIGGIAGRLLGSPTITNHLDICYERSDGNLERLAGALVELKTVLRGAPPELKFLLDAQTLNAGDHFTFMTDAGPLDLLGAPSGSSGYEELKRTATEAELDGLRVHVCSIDDLIRMKRAAGRPKDRIEIEILGALREEIDSLE